MDIGMVAVKKEAVLGSEYGNIWVTVCAISQEHAALP